MLRRHEYSKPKFSRLFIPSVLVCPILFAVAVLMIFLLRRRDQYPFPTYSLSFACAAIFLAFSCFFLTSLTAALIASSASMEQCSFTGGRLRCDAISLFLISVAVFTFFPFTLYLYIHICKHIYTQRHAHMRIQYIFPRQLLSFFVSVCVCVCVSVSGASSCTE